MRMIPTSLCLDLSKPIQIEDLDYTLLVTYAEALNSSLMEPTKTPHTTRKYTCECIAESPSKLPIGCEIMTPKTTATSAQANIRTASSGVTTSMVIQAKSPPIQTINKCIHNRPNYSKEKIHYSRARQE
ncbi:hypothetical protein CHS0354_008585 [Potamilus streckersoni]|uniref:Uncharacterized protein n=1 Tax=Potamilus streckersoni TaxID=2493646 RepID=A0AAE0W1Q7_9BIVA|nr:hypothetical protein CHS0354_008585 [Potamilus streckersoni]